MARMVKKDDSLQREYAILSEKQKKSIKRFFISFGIASAFLLFFIFFELPQLTIVPLVFLYIVSFVFLFNALFIINEIEIVASGIEGEETAANILSGLSDEYTCFQNVKIEYEDKKSEIDMVVVGPTGVFLIETKNMTGYIQGDYNQQKWTQTKVSRAGNEYQREFYSPVKQVKTHVFRLQGVLKQNNVNVYLEPMVYFSSEETPVKFTGGDFSVFSAENGGTEKMLRFIIEKERKLSNEKLAAVCDVLNKIKR